MFSTAFRPVVLGLPAGQSATPAQQSKRNVEGNNHQSRSFRTADLCKEPSLPALHAPLPSETYKFLFAPRSPCMACCRLARPTPAHRRRPHRLPVCIANFRVHIRSVSRLGMCASQRHTFRHIGDFSREKMEKPAYRPQVDIIPLGPP